MLYCALASHWETGISERAGSAILFLAVGRERVGKRPTARSRNDTISRFSRMFVSDLQYTSE